MGPAFARLHPRVQRRFGFSSRDGVHARGRGVMEEIWRGPFWTRPFLWVGSWRNILVPRRGRDVPFQIDNHAYLDSFGRETVTWIRTFRFPDGERRFDATMIYSEERRRVVDYLGTHQHLAVDIELDADDRGALLLGSGEQRFREGPISFTWPLALSGQAAVREGWDEERSRYTIEVKVVNRVFGPLFGYRGWFEVEWLPCPADAVPAGVKPLREERRE
jgi:hypothetical protein